MEGYRLIAAPGAHAAGKVDAITALLAGYEDIELFPVPERELLYFPACRLHHVAQDLLSHRFRLHDQISYRYR
jgi:hypothetical protein